MTSLPLYALLIAMSPPIIAVVAQLAPNEVSTISSISTSTTDIPHESDSNYQTKVSIQFCCHPTKNLMQINTSICLKLQKSEEEIKYDPYIDMIYENLTTVRRNAIEDFTVKMDIPCADISPLKPDLYNTDEWAIYENGGLLVYHGNVILNRSEYCLMPMWSDNNGWKLTAFVCPSPNAAATYNFVWNIFGIISILLILITAMVYILLPELQSVRGKCVINYLLSLALGNIMMTIVSMNEAELTNFLCSFVGFLAYFCYESSFIWVNVMGYDLWQNSKHSGQFAENKTVIRKYAAYAYGIASGMTLIVFILQFSQLPEMYKPGIEAGVCWLNTTTWSALLYFFGLNALLFCINIMFYMLTNSKQIAIPWRNDELALSGSSASYKKGIRIYFWILCILGISWSINLGYYIQDLVEPSGTHFMRYLSDIMSSLEGPLLVWVLVVQTDIIYLLIRRRTMGSAYERQLSEFSESEFTSQF